MALEPDYDDIWNDLDSICPLLDAMRNGKLPEYQVRKLADGLGLAWGEGCTAAEMQQVIWYLMLNTDPVGSFIDDFELAPECPRQLKKKIDDSKRLALGLEVEEDSLPAVQVTPPPKKTSRQASKKSEKSKPEKKKAKTEPAVLETPPPPAKTETPTSSGRVTRTKSKSSEESPYEPAPTSSRPKRKRSAPAEESKSSALLDAPVEPLNHKRRKKEKVFEEDQWDVDGPEEESDEDEIMTMSSDPEDGSFEEPEPKPQRTSNSKKATLKPQPPRRRNVPSRDLTTPKEKEKKPEKMDIDAPSRLHPDLYLALPNDSSYKKPGMHVMSLMSENISNVVMATVYEMPVLDAVAIQDDAEKAKKVNDVNVAFKQEESDYLPSYNDARSQVALQRQKGFGNVMRSMQYNQSLIKPSESANPSGTYRALRDRYEAFKAGLTEPEPMETDPLDTDLSHDFSSMRPHLGSQEINPQQQPTPLKKSSQDLEKLPPFKDEQRSSISEEELPSLSILKRAPSADVEGKKYQDTMNVLSSTLSKMTGYGGGSISRSREALPSITSSPQRHPSSPGASMSSRKSPPSSSPPRGSPSGSPSLVSHSQHHGIPGLAAVTGQAQTNGLPSMMNPLGVRYLQQLALQQHMQAQQHQHHQHQQQAAAAAAQQAQIQAQKAAHQSMLEAQQKMAKMQGSRLPEMMAPGGYSPAEVALIQQQQKSSQMALQEYQRLKQKEEFQQKYFEFQRNQQIQEMNMEREKRHMRHEREEDTKVLVDLARKVDPYHYERAAGASSSPGSLTVNPQLSKLNLPPFDRSHVPSPGASQQSPLPIHTRNPYLNLIKQSPLPSSSSSTSSSSGGSGVDATRGGQTVPNPRMNYASVQRLPSFSPQGPSAVAQASPIQTKKPSPQETPWILPSNFTPPPLAKISAGGQSGVSATLPPFGSK